MDTFLECTLELNLELNYSEDESGVSLEISDMAYKYYLRVYYPVSCLIKYINYYI